MRTEAEIQKIAEVLGKALLSVHAHGLIPKILAGAPITLDQMVSGVEYTLMHLNQLDLLE